MPKILNIAHHHRRRRRHHHHLHHHHHHHHHQFILLLLIIIIIIITTVIDPYEYYMDLCYKSCSSGWPAVHLFAHLVCQKIERWKFHANCKAICSIPAMLIGTVDFYNSTSFLWHWPFLGVTRSAQSKICWLHFATHTFHLVRMKFDVEMKQFKLSIMRLLFSKINVETREIIAVSQTVSKTFDMTSIRTFMDWFYPNVVWW